MVRIAPYIVAVFLVIMAITLIVSPTPFGVVCLAVVSAAFGSTVATAFLSRGRR